MVAEPLSHSIEAAEDEPDSASPALRRLRSVLPQGFQRHIRSARDLDRSSREERQVREASHEAALPTAIPALDLLLDGGLPRGQLVELVGSRTSGRFSTVLATLAAATGVGEVAALVDLGDGLDPSSAEALGVDLQRLLWLRPTNLKQALAATEMVLASGFPLVVLDLGSPPIRGGRGLEAAWLRIARAARAHSTALLVSAPYRVSGTAAGVVLKAERARAAWDGEGHATPLLNGAAARLQIEKHRGRLPGQAEEMKLRVALTPQPSRPERVVVRPKAVEETEVGGGEGLRVAGGRR